MSDYDRWANQKKQIGDDFDEWMLAVFGEEQHGVSPQALEWMHNAWQWSAIRALEMAAGIAAQTYEGGCDARRHDQRRCRKP